jgi:ribosomal protein L15
MAYVIVTLLEELPVTESLEFRDKLKKEFGVNPAIVANKVMHAPVDAKEINETIHSSNAGLAEFAQHVKAVVDRQEEYEKLLAESGAKIVEVPLIFSADAKTLVAKTGEALRAL